jgi:C4-type Zn-finger protein
MVDGLSVDAATVLGYRMRISQLEGHLEQVQEELRLAQESLRSAPTNAELPPSLLSELHKRIEAEATTRTMLVDQLARGLHGVIKVLQNAGLTPEDASATSAEKVRRRARTPQRKARATPPAPRKKSRKVA